MVKQVCAHRTRVSHSHAMHRDLTACTGGAAEPEEKSYGKDPRTTLTGEAVSGWEVPPAGKLGRITSVPELQAALDAAQGSSKLVVIKYFAPWCSSCKSIEAKFVRTAKANAEAAHFYSVGARRPPPPNRGSPPRAARARAARTPRSAQPAPRAPRAAPRARVLFAQTSRRASPSARRAASSSCPWRTSMPRARCRSACLWAPRCTRASSRGSPRSRTGNGGPRPVARHRSRRSSDGCGWILRAASIAAQLTKVPLSALAPLAAPCTCMARCVSAVCHAIYSLCILTHANRRKPWRSSLTLYCCTVHSAAAHKLFIRL